MTLYIHIPFCRSKCPYCDFYSQRGILCDMQLYTNALKERLKRAGQALKGQVLTSVYIGGGTPSFIGPELLSEIISSVKENFTINDNAEFTAECNPSDDIFTLAPVLYGCGVNRISMGLQSAVVTERRSLGRKSDISLIRDEIKAVRDSGIENISLDIMLGIPGQSICSLDETLGFVTDMKVNHMSAYILQLEPGTFMCKNQERYSFPDEDLTAELYLHTCDVSEQAGLIQYEISNFAFPGHESRHNLSYWHDEPYLGLGPGAHSFLNGHRFHFERDINAFINGACAVYDGPGGDKNERDMLSLRLTDGIREPDDVMRSRAEKLSPFVISDEQGIRLTKKGFLVSNEVICQLIYG
jgi:oxygen-independent coproporphyrinogen-3 oxidase